jgi:DNA uptake protein ComE-like DNA-binding protein
MLLCLIVLSACASAAPTSTSSTTSSNSSSSPSVDSANVTKVNLNTASGDDFIAVIPGLRNRMVREFMEYRPYISIQQF